MTSILVLMMACGCLYVSYLFFETLGHHTHGSFLIVRWYLLGVIVLFVTMKLCAVNAYGWLVGLTVFITGLIHGKSFGIWLKAIWLTGAFAWCYGWSFLPYGTIEYTSMIFLIGLCAWMILLSFLLSKQDALCDFSYQLPFVLYLICMIILLSISLEHANAWIALLSGCLTLISFGAYRMLYTMERKKWDELRAQESAYTRLGNRERYERIEKENEFIMRSMHDLKKQMRVLEGQPKEEDRELREGVLKRSQALMQEQRSGNTIIDQVMRYYQPRFLDAQIQCNLMCESIDYALFDPVDLCAVLCNLLDNAYDSCMQCEERFILLRMCQQEEQILWKMKNSCRQRESDSRRFHGFGLRNIKQICQKYGGDFIYEWDDAHNVFISHVYFAPLMMDSEPLL